MHAVSASSSLTQGPVHFVIMPVPPVQTVADLQMSGALATQFTASSNAEAQFALSMIFCSRSHCDVHAASISLCVALGPGLGQASNASQIEMQSPVELPQPERPIVPTSAVARAPAAIRRSSFRATAPPYQPRRPASAATDASPVLLRDAIEAFVMDAPPAADPESAWMKHLERAHDRALFAARAFEDESEPNAHVGPAARTLERGLAALYDAFDGRADRPTAMNAAGARFWDAAVLAARGGLADVVAALREACSELLAAETRLPRVALAGFGDRALVAGDATPRLHVVARASIIPDLKTPDSPPPAADTAPLATPDRNSFEELAAVDETAKRRALASRPKAVAPALREARPLPPPPAEPPPGFAFPPPPAISEAAVIHRWARECFFEIGMLGLQRLPLPGDDWRACRSLDRRLVTALDAVAALGPVALAHLESIAMDAPSVDPMRVFAMAMVGGSFEGRDVLGCAERVLHRFGAADPLIFEPFAAALKLSANAFVPSAMATLFHSGVTGRRAIAIDVLAHRGGLDERQLAELCESTDPRELALGLRALGVARHRDLSRVVERALAHQDREVVAAALDALILASRPEAASAARAAASGVLGDEALIRLAMIATFDDARWLLDRMRAAPSAASIEAVGRAGLVAAVAPLIGLLGDDEEIALAAGAALERLLGANLVDTIEIDPEALEMVPVIDPDPDAAPAPAPLAETVGDPRDRPPAGSKERLEVPSKDPEKWRAYWAEHGRRLDPKLRTRRGKPYSALALFEELDRAPLGPDDRRRVHLELVARAGRHLPFDPCDFVVTQEAHLKAWETLAKQGSDAPGSWEQSARR